MLSIMTSTGFKCTISKFQTTWKWKTSNVELEPLIHSCRDIDSQPAEFLVCTFLAAPTQQSWPPLWFSLQKTSLSLTSKHLVAASATSMVGFPALLLSVRSWNNGFGPRSPVHRLCLLSFSRPPPTARCPSQGRRPNHSLVAIELHHRFKWTKMWINLASNQRIEKHLHKQQ